MSDSFSGFAASLEGPATNGFLITPNDSVDLGQVTRALYVGSGGNVTATLQDGGQVTFINVADGALLPIRAERIHATNTTASDILGLL